MAIAIMAFSFDFSNGALNVIPAAVILGITVLIFAVSLATLAIRQKNKKKGT